MKKITQDELRKYIREALSNIDLNELDSLIPKSIGKWKDEASELRADLVDLMKNIERDDFADDIKKINNAIKHLNNWKIKIEKFL